MSISITSGVMIPVSVVEVGNEITQDQLNAITAATLPSVGNVFITQSLLTSSLTPYAFIASPTFTGTPTLPTGTIGVTQSTADNSTKLATTAFVKAQSYLTTTTAASTYQTISGMSSYLTTSSASSTYQTISGMTSYAPKANPTFTGTVTIPSGASISGYLTTSSASSTYQTISGMSSYATQSYVTSQGYLTDAPSNGSEYVRKNGAWAVATGGGGGGGGISEAPNDGGNYLRNMSAWVNVSTLGYQTSTDVSTYVTGLGYITSSALTVTNIDLTGDFNGKSMGSGYYSFKYDSSTNTLRMQDGVGSGISISATAITFPDGSTQTKAPTGGYVDGGMSGYTLTPSDAGKVIKMGNTSGPLTMSFSGSFVPGSVFYIINTSGSFSCTLDSGGMSGYAINNDFTNPFLIPINTMKTMVCVSATEFWIS